MLCVHLFPNMWHTKNSRFVCYLSFPLLAHDSFSSLVGIREVAE